MFTFNEEDIKNKQVLLYIIFAYLFSVVIRYIWVYQFKDFSEFYWNNQLMINTNDGYYFATVVKNLLFSSNQPNQILPLALDTYPGTIYSIYFLAKILPFSLDTIILYAPAFISSLIVIPIILILRLFKLTFVGFLSALLASITWSFYNRTMIGYFDTDMYALVFPMFILYFMIRFFVKNEFLSSFIATIITAFYVVFYPQGYAAIGALFVMSIVYGGFTLRKEKSFYLAIILFSISLIEIALILKVILLSIVYFSSFKVNIKQKYLIYTALLSLAIFAIFSDVYSLILSKINWYTTTGIEGKSIHFYDVAQTIREAGKIPFETFANRISGSIITFILGVIGYIVLVFKKREFLLFLPLIAIGFFAYIGGLRFTVYAIPAMSIGAVYLFYFIFDKFIHNELTRNILILAVAILMIYPNIKHIIGYKVPTVFTKQEVTVLDKLRQISNPKDYTLTWWDYGYPIWYYSNTNTLIDGGKHHRDNFIISEILTTNSPQETLNLARLSVEKYEKEKLGYAPIATELFKDKNPNQFLKELKKDDFKLPRKTRDIYLYLPNRMLNIFPTIDLFSNIDLENGNKKYNTFFYISKNFRENSQLLDLGNGIALNKKNSMLRLGRSQIPLNSITITEYDKSGKLQVFKKELYPQSNIFMIVMKNYHQILVLDKRMYNSTFVQMFVLEKYDKDLFEPVIMTPLVKVFKLKR